MKRWLLAGAVVLLAAAAVLVWQLGATSDEPHDAPVATPAPAVPARPLPPPALRPDPATTIAALAGTVRDDAGAPIAAATVCLIERMATRCIPADARGRYAFPSVPATTTAVAGSAPKLRPDIEPLDRHAGATTIDLVLAPRGVPVRGSVLGLDGRPIAKAQIMSNAARAETSATGRFELWVAPGRLNLRAVADGYAETPRWVTAPSEIEIVLVPEGSIAGTVVDDATGAPVPNVRVGIEAIESEAAETITGADGSFTLAHLAPARYRLRASTPRSFGVALDVRLGMGQRKIGVVMRMRAAHQVSIKILNTDGSACAGEGRLDEWGSPIGAPWRDRAITRIDGVPPGRYMATGWCGALRPPGRVIDVVSDMEVVIAADPASGTLRGRVVGERSAGVRVWVRSDKVVSRSTIVDDDGGFAFSLPAGRYTIVAGGFKPETAEEVVDVPAGAIVERTFTLPRSSDGQLVVDVVDREGHPMPFTSLWIYSRKWSTTVETDQEGTASVTLESGDYVVTTRSESTTANVSPGIRQIRFVVDDPARVIRGTVVDPDRRPVAGAVVSFERDVTRFAITAADGTFSLPGGSPESFASLVAYRIGSAEHAEGFGSPDAPTTLVLGGTASIAGTVVRSDGTVPERFDIIIKAPTGGNPSNPGRTTRTFFHTRGAFQVDEFPAGALQIGAAINGVETWTAVSLAAAQQRTGVALTVPPLATITGRVVDAGSRAPIGDAHLQLRCDRDGVPLAFNHAEQVSMSDGRFTIRDLPPGPCAVEITPPGTTWIRAIQQILVPDRGVGDIGELVLARART